jgi:catechol 2,3-dioxygenase-like lactoylglutathione lyase family enzyme
VIVKRLAGVAALLLAGMSASAAEPSLLGAGMGLNHVTVLVRDLRATSALFNERLGFNVKYGGQFPEGLENAGVAFSDHSYLEFLAVYDPKKAALSEEAAFLKEHQGANGIGLETDSAKRALTLLHARGIAAKISTTSGADYVEPGEKTSTDWLWREIDLPKATPGGPFLIQYNRIASAARAKTDPAGEQQRALERVHANGATRMSAVWIAVSDLHAAIDAYQRLGFGCTKAIEWPELSAHGCEIAAGSGKLLLLTPVTDAIRPNPVVDFLAERGNGPMGVTITMADLTRAREYLNEHAAGIVDIQRQSQDYVLIPATVTQGVWLRLEHLAP